ncbi:Alpha/Beta hydrolase protein [Podospora appendiculata]|uniref:Carboxylic ester hydrolase n=1 Tax=Podospora appendiculata TaxID=314037 RepID=A0AAE0X0Q1_9PEZI|nr:Alpha/Beta hydrolase protein [Podospora appendiculata]
MKPLNLLLPLSLFHTAACAISTSIDDPLTVRTTTGSYTGLLDDQFPNVRQFRSIPYAQPPIGKQRWRPPVAVTPSLRRYFSQRFPPSCPQYQSKTLTAWTTNISDFSIRLYGQSYIAGAMSQASSEDCLYLAIWAPLNVTANSTLPVALFLPGGDFVGGGVDVPYQQPAGWVERTQNHIVVTANYRVNVAGFPWAAGIDTEDQNVGILDQRMALEWVHTNIGAFGGDASRITLWGQSAGGVAVDMLAHAYYDNPLVSGLFMQSGTAMVGVARADPGHTNFTFVAKNLGCDFPGDAAAELDCMKQVPMTLIQNFIGQYKDNGTKSAIVFKPLPDDKKVWFNYTERAAKGFVARVPVLVSTTANELSTLYSYPASNVTAGPYQPAVDAGTVGVFVCLASNTTQSRIKQNITTYRYEYAGNFSSVTPLWWMGAYHASDVPMLFGTYNLPPGGGGEDVAAVTPFQTQVAETMQDYLLEFMKDPENGLRQKGWLPYGDPRGKEGKNMLRFAAGGLVAQNVSAAQVDDACVLGTKYDSSPS